MPRKWLLSVFALVVWVLALVPTMAHEESAHVRVVHLAADAPNVDVFVNGEAALEDVSAGQFSRFLELEPGTISLVIAPTGEGIDAAVVGPLDLEAEGSYRYTVAVIGQASDNSLKALLIDESEALEDVDLSKGAFHILVNNIAGSPPITGYYDDVTFADNVGYGEAGMKFSPVGGWSILKFVSGDDPETFIFDLYNEEGVPAGFVEPNAIYFVGLMGHYPGAAFEDYSLTVSLDSPVNIIDMLAGFHGLGLTYGDVKYEFSTLLKAIEVAGLTETLTSEGPYTLFAPTDEAFAALPAGTLDALMADPEALRELLLYHVVEGDVSYERLVEAGKVMTMQGPDITITARDDGDLLGNGEVVISESSYGVTNGRLYTIDNPAVLMPPKN